VQFDHEPRSAALPPVGPETDGLLLAGVTLGDGRRVDVRLRAGLIEAVGPAGSLAPAVERMDLAGYLLLPAPAEPHAHLDKALSAGRVANPRGDLAGAIEAWDAYQATMPSADTVRRATEAALLALAHGATAIRSHVNVGDSIGLRSLAALIEVREALRGRVEIQLAALPVRPLTGSAGEGNRRALREAAERGVDVIGGCPHIDPDPHGAHAVCLSVADEFGRPVDVHTDETLDPAALHLEDLSEQVTSSGFRHGVTASHCVSLGMQQPDIARRVAERVAAAGIAVVCNPQTNLYLQARDLQTTKPRGLTALDALLSAGVTVAGGGDNMRDPFNSVGRGDPLETASLLVCAGHLTNEQAYAAVSAGARAAMGLPEVRIAPGFPAELLAIRATSTADAVAAASEDRVVIHRGRVVCRTRVSREYAEPAAGSAGQNSASRTTVGAEPA
jgi:cytosine/creatinine deaminase